MKTFIGSFIIWLLLTGKFKTFLAFATTGNDAVDPQKLSQLNPNANDAVGAQSVGNAVLRTILPSVAGAGAFTGATIAPPIGKGGR